MNKQQHIARRTLRAFKQRQRGEIRWDVWYLAFLCAVGAVCVVFIAGRIYVHQHHQNITRIDWSQVPVAHGSPEHITANQRAFERERRREYEALAFERITSGTSWSGSNPAAWVR